MKDHDKNIGLDLKTILESRFLYLLISLLLLFFLYPFFETMSVGVRILDIVYVFILLSGVYAINERKFIFIISLILAVTGFTSDILYYIFKITPLRVLTISAYGMFFTILTAVILDHIIRAKKVTTGIIYGSICGFLLIGINWTMLFSLVEILEPGSFLYAGAHLIDSSNELVRRHAFSDFTYYSFVTLTTLGYGDITPASPPAKALSSLEAVTGQLYIAVLIARLVGLNIAHAERT